MKYFETKVVRVNKPKSIEVNSRGAGKSTKYMSSISDKALERIQINAKREIERRKMVKTEKKGNWVNGENLDKIKFPCFCSFKNLDNKLLIGEIDFVYWMGDAFYRLRELKQVIAGEAACYEHTERDLKVLIEDWDLHIQKGKIIIWEE